MTNLNLPIDTSYSTISYATLPRPQHHLASPHPTNSTQQLPNPPQSYVFFQRNAAGCLVELPVQLAIIMVAKQIFNDSMEIILP